MQIVSSILAENFSLAIFEKIFFSDISCKKNSARFLTVVSLVESDFLFNRLLHCIEVVFV